MLNEFTKKEAPIQGLAGLGGGVPSRLLTLASGTPTYIDDVFSTNLWDGTGSTQTITNGIDLDGEGGMIWTKGREVSENHMVHDSERGKTGSYYDALQTNVTNADYTDAPYGPTSFNSDGFTLGGNNAQFNGSTDGSYCSWTFRKCPGFFDVVKFTGNGSNSGVTVSHSLGSVPGSIWVKDLDATTDWTVYHRSGPVDSSPPSGVPAGSLKCAKLNSSDAFTRSPNIINTVTSSSFIFGTNGALNTSGNEYIAYIFAHNDGSFGEDSDEAVIKCESYTGTGNADFSEKTLGFEPQWVMVKRTDDSGPWLIADNMRGIFSDASDDNLLQANANGSEADYKFNAMSLTPRGFTTVNNVGSVNGQGANYIYIAIRRPHKPPETGTDVFAMDINTQGEPEYVSNFVVDWAFHRNVPYADDWIASTRLLGPRNLVINSTATESSSSASVFDFNNGWGDNLANDTNYQSWMFRRAPGFFDVVAYSGSSSAQNISHNLTVKPEMIITKNRTTSDGWGVQHSALGATKRIRLSHEFSASTNSGYWNDTEPTASVFTVGTDKATGQNGSDYVGFLFATLSGISKVGSYSGTGSNIDVDCGFTAGARFILIKRSDATADWYVYDSTRGIVSGNDPYLVINEQDAEVTNTDYIDPLNAGFTVTSSAPDGLNASGGNYIFLAIA